MSVSYHPRGDRVVVRRIQVGQTPSGIKVSDLSIEGVYYKVEAVGPKVENLEVGDKCLLVGQKGLHYDYLPNERDLIISREDCIWATYTSDE